MCLGARARVSVCVWEGRDDCRCVYGDREEPGKQQSDNTPTRANQRRPREEVRVAREVQPVQIEADETSSSSVATERELEPDLRSRSCRRCYHHDVSSPSRSLFSSGCRSGAISRLSADGH